MGEADGEWKQGDAASDVGVECLNTGEVHHSTSAALSIRADRSASNPVSETDDRHQSQPILLGLPKRSSVPTLRSHDPDDSGVGLNYAFLQVCFIIFEL